MSVDGHWVGHYYQDKGPPLSGGTTDLAENTFPIEAWLETSGSRLTGRMTDLQPIQERKYADVVAAESRSLSWFQRWMAKLYLARHPDCICRSSLFPESRLEGTVEGDHVSFTKTYQGPCAYALCSGDVRHVRRIKSQRVDYSGSLQPDGNLITGVYRLGGPRQAGRQTFELRRVP